MNDWRWGNSALWLTRAERRALRFKGNRNTVSRKGWTR